LTCEELDLLAADIRGFLVDAVGRTGGHLGPNLGVVELTIAVHRVFDSPIDRIVWDTGHQAYVHKLLTGRQNFVALRARDGLSGYPQRAESEHDVVENSHASTALAYADGLAKAHRLRGEDHRCIVAILGDGALTGGMAWEALNNIADSGHNVVIVLNDNGRSYSATVGGMARHLSALETASTNGAVVPNVFTDLGIHYIGPVDGHDVRATESALATARQIPGPVLVHCRTVKGRGYPPAESNDVDRCHTVPPTSTVQPMSQSRKRTWTRLFSDEMVRIGERRRDVVGVTAAMLHPVGLAEFAARYPGRVFDVGIAEQHAVTSSAGLALGGLHPVVAIYATFMNRAFDQVLMDCALHRCGVTFVLDRAGVTGEDGASHNGMWDLSVLQAVPGLRIAAPRDAVTLRDELLDALDVADEPTALRFPKGDVVEEIPAVQSIDGVDVLYRSVADDRPVDVLLVAVGVMAERSLHAAAILESVGIAATVVDPRWVKPVNPALAAMAARHDLVVTVEDNLRVGGVGATVAQALHDARVETPCRNLGIDLRFLSHASREQILADMGLTGDGIAEQIALDVAAYRSATASRRDRREG
jgi:1-deoxy-D-xylulose-5-phosphate synthase